MDYWLHATFKGDTHVAANLVAPMEITTNNNGEQVPVVVWVAKHSDERDIVKAPVTMELPLKDFPRNALGKRVTPVFKIATRAQWEPKPFTDTVQPKIPVLLPPSKPMPDNIVGLNALNEAAQANATGAYREAVELANRALEDSTLSKEQRLKAYEVLSASYMNQSDLTGMIEAANAALEDGHAKEPFLLNRGMAYLALGDLNKAKTDFETCIEPATSPKLFPCSVGLLLAQGHQGKQSFDGVVKRFGEKIKDVPYTHDIHAQVLAMILGAFKSDQLGTRVQQISKERTDLILNLTAAYYYLGQSALLNNDPDLTRDMFERSSSSGGVNLERALARHWLYPQQTEAKLENKQPPAKKETVAPSQKETVAIEGTEQSSAAELNGSALVMAGVKQDEAMANEAISMITAALEVDAKGEMQLSDNEKDEAYSTLAYTYMLKGDVKKSLEFSQMSAPTMTDGFIVKGLAQLLLNQKTEAIKTFATCLEEIKGYPVNVQCEIWRIIGDSFGGTDVNATVSPEVVSLVKKMESSSLLAVNTALLLFSAKESFHNVIENEKLMSGGDEEEVYYSHNLSFYLGMWAFLHGTNELAIDYFQDAAEGAVPTPERTYSRLLLVKTGAVRLKQP